jgi:protein-S-isoprenylcysteine O-methyltransferase Ste14
MEIKCPNTVIHKIFHILLLLLAPALFLAFIIFFNYGKNIILRIFGIILLILSSFLGWLPVNIFKKQGKVPEGEGYVKTTKLVTTGIYSIVRHPQYLAGMLLGFSFIIISQHWLVLVLGIPFMIIFYIAGWDEDKFCVKKFGKEYEDYMKKVPRFNLILGLIKKI